MGGGLVADETGVAASLSRCGAEESCSGTHCALVGSTKAKQAKIMKAVTIEAQEDLITRAQGISAL